MGQGITSNQLAPGVQTVYSHPFEIAHADILTLPSAGVIVLPALGANILAVFDSITLVKDAAAGAYTNLSSFFLYCSYHVDDDITASEDITTLSLHTTGPTFATGKRKASMGGALAEAANQAIYLHGSNGAGDLTGGNAANVITGFVHYAVLDLT